jgi:hypothetical protein
MSTVEVVEAVLRARVRQGKGVYSAHLMAMFLECLHWNGTQWLSASQESSSALSSPYYSEYMDHSGQYLVLYLG